MPERDRSSSQRETSFHSATSMGDSSYRYRPVSNSSFVRTADSRPRETQARREWTFSHNRSYPGYSPQGVQSHGATQQSARTPRKEYKGPFADQRDQLIVAFQDAGNDLLPASAEMTDSSGSGSSHGSFSESMGWAAHHEKPHARNYGGILLDQKMPACLKQPPPIPVSPSKSCFGTSFPTIEVAPGVFLRLRGAAETSWAIRNDFYIPIECVCCTRTILCIQDADYVLCPDCRVVGPIRPPQERSNGGVGLGCRPDAVFAPGSA